MKELVIFTCASEEDVAVVVDRFFHGVAFTRRICQGTAHIFKIENAIVSLYALVGLKAALRKLDTTINDVDIQVM